VTVLVVLLAASGVASAQTTGTGTLPNSATITFPKLYTYQSSTDTIGVQTEAASDARLQYFNLAHCVCSVANSNNQLGKFSYLVQETAQSGLHYPVDFWIGTGCDDITQRNSSTGNCIKVGSFNDLDVALYPGGTQQKFSLADAVNGKSPPTDGSVCAASNNAGLSIYAFVSSTGSTSSYDYDATQTPGTVSTDVSTTGGIDTQPPPAATNAKASPTESGIDVSWTPSTDNNTDVAYYQALCATADGQPAGNESNDPRYVTTASVCPGVAPPMSAETLTQITLSDDERDPADIDLNGAPSGDFGALGRSFICGEADSATASGLSIGGLANGTPYQVILLTVDRHGNFVGNYFSRTITPHLVTDFWEDLHDRGSKVQGGLCLLAETYGDDSGLTQTMRRFRDDTLGGSGVGRWLTHAYYATGGRLGGLVHGSLALRILAGALLLPIVALALAWHALTLPGLIAVLWAAWLIWRHRTRLAGWLRRLGRVRWVRAATVIAIVVPGAARADVGGGYQPYWENSDPLDNDDQTPVLGEPPPVHWHVGVKVGPYVPDIDKQFGGKPGPYEQMFGNFRLLPMLDVERIIWSGFGQIGVGGTIGYLQRSARAFAMGSDPADPNRARDPNARNSFHLIPFALTATYRFTLLDDEYSIPLVPYVRGGLSYYVWWMAAPSGNFSVACKDGTTNEDTCDLTKAFGASLGVQGAIGLAIRAERIDAAAARSMRASGIQHAGIYGELSAAKVDGFGSDSKLSVGARTWFAGVDFEF
jgi:hypothetical protein